MNTTVINQFYSFLIYIGIGILITLIFDIFRILRKSFKTSDTITLIEDIIFVLIAGFLFIGSVFKFNSGEIRIYIFIGIALGCLIYLTTVSNFFIKTSVNIINLIKRIIIKIIITPFLFIYKVLRKYFLKPVSFFFINFRTFFTIKNKNIIRKSKVKKGF